MPPAVWGDHFWSEDSTATAGYDALISRLNSSHSTIKALVTHYSERIVTEEEYVKKFSKTLKEDLSQNESGTVKETLVQIQNSLESALRAHEQLTSKLRDSLVSPLESFADNQKRLRKQVEGEHKRQADMLKIEFSSMEKCGKEYISRCKDVAKAEEKANQPIKEKQSQKDYDKIQDQATKAKAERDRAELDYISSIDKFNSFQDAFDRKWVELCNMVQKNEEERVLIVKSALKHAIMSELELSQMYTITFDRMREAVDMINATVDLDLFVECSRTGSNRNQRFEFVSYGEAIQRAGQNVTPAFVRAIRASTTQLDAQEPVDDYEGATPRNLGRTLEGKGTSPISLSQTHPQFALPTIRDERPSVAKSGIKLTGPVSASDKNSEEPTRLSRTDTLSSEPGRSALPSVPSPFISRAPSLGRHSQRTGTANDSLASPPVMMDYQKQDSPTNQGLESGNSHSAASSYLVEQLSTTLINMRVDATRSALEGSVEPSSVNAVASSAGSIGKTEEDILAEAIPPNLVKRSYSRRTIKNEGWLELAEEGNKLWTKRWCAVEGGFLWFFENPQDNVKPQGLNRPKGMVGLSKATIEEGSNVSWVPEGGSRNFVLAINVEKGKRTVLIASHSEEEMYYWADALLASKKRVVGTVFQ